MGQHVFISYAHANKRYAVRLAEELRTRRFEVWIDTDLRHGERWPEKLEQAVRDCAALIVIMTPEAEASEWVNNEVNLAMSTGKAIFPLLLRGQVFKSIGEIQYAEVSVKKMPDEDFFGDLTMAPGVKTGVEQFYYRERSRFEKVMEKSPFREVLKRYDIESGMIDDPEEVESWENYLRENKDKGRKRPR
jgi:hypothetical protein